MRWNGLHAEQVSWPNWHVWLGSSVHGLTVPSVSLSASTRGLSRDRPTIPVDSKRCPVWSYAGGPAPIRAAKSSSGYPCNEIGRSLLRRRHFRCVNNRRRVWSCGWAAVLCSRSRAGGFSDGPSRNKHNNSSLFDRRLKNISTTTTRI